MRQDDRVTSRGDLPPGLRPGLPAGWTTAEPHEADTAELTAELTGLLRRHEEHARGWSGATQDDVRVALSRPPTTLSGASLSGASGPRARRNLVLRDAGGVVRGWASTHDRAAGRMVLTALVDWRLPENVADAAATALLVWAEREAERVGRLRGLATQQMDTGAFDGDERQQRWLADAGFERVRTWWQMTRPVAADEVDLLPGAGEGVLIRTVRRQGTGMPDEDDLRTVHDVLESAFADHFNSHTETFEEFLTRLREDPGHRWDHWWVAELVDGPEPEPAGALVGSVLEDGPDPGPGSGGAQRRGEGSYVEYLGVLPNARGRGVAKALLRTVVADAAALGRDRVGLEVDADSPTGADRLYVSMGWTTSYVTQSWHKDVPVPAEASAP
jgi:ribosomal protein S18 acetylase RimI-like enzyme